MNRSARWLLPSIAALVTSFSSLTTHAETNVVMNISGNPGIFECNLTAMELDVKIVTTNGAALFTNTVHAMVYKDENAPGWPVGKGIPIPVMYLTPGQTVICHFRNNLPTADVPDGASIHWHGIELDNDSDGTGVTQDSVLLGESYEYRFIAPRPGLFWFHSHMMPGDATFAGMYGVIIIPNDIESSLTDYNVLPTTNFTYLLAMSDIEFTTNVFTGTNGIPIPAGTVGRISQDHTNQFLTIDGWEMLCHNNPGSKTNCATAARPGAVVLVNGEHPQALPAFRTPVYTVPKNKLIRLQLLNEALTRNFRVKLLDASGNQIKLYHIGGQGGLLDYARLEGGTNQSWDSGYSQGEIVIGSGDRIDTLAYTGAGASGAVLRLVGNPLPAPFNYDGPTLVGVPNIPSNYPIAFFQLNNVNAGDTAPTNGTPILEFFGQSIGALGPPTNSLVDPTGLGLPGTTNPVISLTQVNSAPSIDSIQAGILDGNTGDGAFLSVPRTNNDRYAYVGNLIQLSVDNKTQQVHPFHFHGFSFQPVDITDDELSPPTNTLYSFSYNDFLDTINVYPGQTLTFKVSLDDRPKLCDESPSFPPGPVLRPCYDASCGGAIGRWVYHCHIFAHAGDGMISEFNVLEDATPFTNLFKAIQHPDTTPTGVDVLATAGSGSQMVADDFLCTTSGPITGITIWGSWLNDFVDPNTTFELKFWTDIPGNPSSPGAQLWRVVFPPGTYSNSLANYVLPSEYFWDPSQPGLIASDSQVYRYDFAMDQCSAFYQNSGNIYWLSVTAYPTTNALFGWKTCFTNDAYGDDSTWSPITNYPSAWSELIYPSFHPYQGVSMDQSFQINTVVSTNCQTPVASFSAYPTSGTEPLLVSFTDSSTGSITNWFWDFGDSNTTNLATGASVSHTYAAGFYQAKLIVSGLCGSSTNTQTITTGSCVPVASFYGSPTSGTEPLPVNFFDTSSGTLTNWFWNFGDGNATNVAFGSVSHTYTAGTYSVTLTISGPCGTNTVTLSNYIIVASCKPVAGFFASPTTGTEPQDVNFFDTSSGTITNWFWNFGDGHTTNVPTTFVDHIYTAGTYSVTLVVSGPCGIGTTNIPNYIDILTAFQGWQMYYFGSTNSPNGASNADPDRDGFSNLQEQLAGFNPLSGTAYPRIISILRTNNNIKVIYLGANGDNSWYPGIAARTNVLEFTKGTANGSYSNNFVSTGLTNILSGGNGFGVVTNMIEIGGATNKPSRYYRVRVLVP